MKFFHFATSILLTCHLFSAVAEGENGSAMNESTTMPPKSAVTVWWVIFNNPSMCATAPGEDIACGSGDLANEAAEPAAIWAAGGVANEEGKLHLTAGLYRTADPLPDLDAEIDFKGLQRGWTSPDAEVHLVVRTHGPVVMENDGYLEQISNFNDDFDGCCENQQAAPYAPGEDGQKALYMMSDRTEIGGTKAILNRRGDLLQAVIETIDPVLAAMEDTPTLPVSPKAAAGATDSKPAKSAYTTWWVIFNNPSMCATAPGEDIACGSGDLANEAAEPAAIWAAGGVVGDDGVLSMTSGLYRTADPLPDLDAEIDFKGLQRGWTSPDAEVHLVVRTHGPVVMENDGYLEQISNFNDDFDGCCENQQAAPYAPGEDGQKALYMMSDRTEIGGTKAILLRRGDFLQAIIETTDPVMKHETTDPVMMDTLVDPPEESMDPVSGDPDDLDDETSAGCGAFNVEMVGVIFILPTFLGLF